MNYSMKTNLFLLCMPLSSNLTSIGKNQIRAMIIEIKAIKQGRLSILAAILLDLLHSFSLCMCMNM